MFCDCRAGLDLTPGVVAWEVRRGISNLQYPGSIGLRLVKQQTIVFRQIATKHSAKQLSKLQPKVWLAFAASWRSPRVSQPDYPAQA